nr:hypothetical protein [uncultured Rhodopila sp.]
MAATRRNSGKAETPKARISRLREEIASLAADPLTPAVANAAASANRAFGDVSALVQDRTRLISSQLEQRPITAVLVALALGWLASRLFR